MHGDVVIIVLLLVLGCAAFFFGLIYAVCRGLALMARSAARLLRCGRDGTCSVRVEGIPKVCPRQPCRHPEYRRGARFCSRCGTALH